MELLLMLLLLAAPAMACRKGTYEYRGDCVVEVTPEIANAVKPLSDKPPRSGRAGSEAPSVQIIPATDTREADVKWDKEKLDAEREGKRSAGIK